MNKPIRCTTHFHACDCREYEFEQLRKENQEMREALREANELIDALSRDVNYMDQEPSHWAEWANRYRAKFPLSETPNSSKEGVNCSHCSGNHLNFDCPTMANE